MPIFNQRETTTKKGVSHLTKTLGLKHQGSHDFHWNPSDLLMWILLLDAQEVFSGTLNLCITSKSFFLSVLIVCIFLLLSSNSSLFVRFSLWLSTSAKIFTIPFQYWWADGLISSIVPFKCRETVSFWCTYRPILIHSWTHTDSLSGSLWVRLELWLGVQGFLNW